MTDFTATVSEGKLPRTVSEKIAALIRSLDGKRVTVTVKEAKRKRSTQANAFYWAAVIPPIVQKLREAGNMVDAEDVHNYLKDEVGKLRRVIVLPDGEIKRIPGSTANLTTAEFQAYLIAVTTWAAEHGIEIEPPGKPLTEMQY